MRRRLIATIIAFAALAPAALADERVARTGQVTATLSFERPSDYEFTDLRLRVDRAGATVFEEPVDIPDCWEPYCAPADAYDHSDALRVADLDADGEPGLISTFGQRGSRSGCLTSTGREPYQLRPGS